MNRSRKLFLLSPVVALVGLLGTAAPSSAASKVAAPKITGVWARTSPAGTTMGAAYAKFTSAAGDRLLSASVPKTVAAKVEIHETVAAMPATTMAGMTATTMAGMSGTTMAGMSSMEGMDQAMTMRPITGLDLPAGKTVELKPGGYHIMFIGLAKPLKTGDKFTLTLTFKKAGVVKVVVPVKPA